MAETAAPPALPPLSERTAFLEEARAFARQAETTLAGRFLGLFTRCSGDDLRRLLAKVHCEAHPLNYGVPESPDRSLLKAFAHPWHYLLTRSWLWSPEPPVLFDFHTVDRALLDRRYGRIWERLPGPKRLSADRPESFAGTPGVADAPGTSVAPRCLALLFLWPLLAPSLWLLSRREGRNLLAAYRSALGLYAAFDAHFRRRPCRHFVTYSDESNHPARWLAFRQNCAGRLVVIQNGERTHHPAYAFGALDVHMAFGPYLARVWRELDVLFERVEAVGSLNLDERKALVDAEGTPPKEWDVLFVDQGVWPQNQLDEPGGRSLETLMRLLAGLKAERPDLRLAYQLRDYTGRGEARRATEAALARSLGPGVAVLANSGAGESYRNALRARIVMTYESTFGAEAFHLGPGGRGLFVNVAGNPYEVYCDDPRFQHYDPAADPAAFREKVLELLAAELPEVPPAARERVCVFDGRTQERIAALLAGPEYRP